METSKAGRTPLCWRVEVFILNAEFSFRLTLTTTIREMKKLVVAVRAVGFASIVYVKPLVAIP